MIPSLQKTTTKLTLFKVSLFICFLCAFALGIKSLREPDLWWQIRTGEWILSHGEVPKIDVFSYTFAGTAWVNIKWGFEVLAAWITRLCGAQNIFVLQALVNLLLVCLLTLTAKEYRKTTSTVGNENAAFQFSLITGLIVFLVASEYRMIGRPEMFSHLFTAFYLYLFLENRNRLTGKIFFIVPLQMLWTNMHEAYATGIIITAVYCLGAWYVYFTSPKYNDSKKRALWLSFVLIFSIAVIVINPNGYKLLLQPFEIFRQVNANKYTTELFPSTTIAYWQKEAWIALGILLLCLIQIIKLFIGRGKKKKVKTQPFDPALFILFIAFAYLGADAFRNIIFFTIVSFPWLVTSLEWVSSGILSKGKNSVTVGYILFAATVLFYLLIVSNKFYEITNSRDRFGLEVMSINNPVGAAKYIRSQNLEKEKCFSDYLSSSCLLYELRPDFKSYIDLRDLDIFPTNFFEEYIQLANNPAEFRKLDEEMNFKYVVLYRIENQPLHTFLYNDSLFALTYLDANSAVYVKTDSFSRADIFTRSTSLPSGIFSDVINHVLNPLYHSFDLTTVDYDDIAGHYYLQVLRFDLAMQRAENLIRHPQRKYKGLILTGEILYQKALREKDSTKKAELLTESQNYFFDGLRINKNAQDAHFGLALVYIQNSSDEAALKELDKSIELDGSQYSTFVAAAFIAKKQYLNSRNDFKKAEQMAYYFSKASRLNPGNPEILFNAGLSYYYLNDCGKASHYFREALKSNYLQAESRLAAEKYLKTCSN